MDFSAADSHSEGKCIQGVQAALRIDANDMGRGHSNQVTDLVMTSSEQQMDDETLGSSGRRTYRLDGEGCQTTVTTPEHLDNSHSSHRNENSGNNDIGSLFELIDIPSAEDLNGFDSALEQMDFGRDADADLHPLMHMLTRSPTHDQPISEKEKCVSSGVTDDKEKQRVEVHDLDTADIATEMDVTGEDPPDATRLAKGSGQRVGEEAKEEQEASNSREGHRETEAPSSTRASGADHTHERRLVQLDEQANRQTLPKQIEGTPIDAPYPTPLFEDDGPAPENLVGGTYHHGMFLHSCYSLPTASPRELNGTRTLADGFRQSSRDSQSNQRESRANDPVLQEFTNSERLCEPYEDGYDRSAAAQELLPEGFIDHDYMVQHQQRQYLNEDLQPDSVRFPSRQMSAPAGYQQEHLHTHPTQHEEYLQVAQERTQRIRPSQTRRTGGRSHALPPLHSLPPPQPQRAFKSAPAAVGRATTAARLPLRRSHSAMSAEHRCPYPVMLQGGSPTKAVRRTAAQHAYPCENRAINQASAQGKTVAPGSFAQPRHANSAYNVRDQHAIQRDSIGMFAQEPCNYHVVLPAATSHHTMQTASLPNLPNNHVDEAGKPKVLVPDISDREKAAKLMRTISGNNASFKGVSRQKWMARWEAHILLPDDQKVFLGGFDSKEKAARVHDLATIKLLGRSVSESQLNFPVSAYETLLRQNSFIERMGADEFVQRLRKQSAGYREKGSRSMKGRQAALNCPLSKVVRSLAG